MCWFPPGEDNNIYCKFCYHRKFAPVGYRQYTYPTTHPCYLDQSYLSFTSGEQAVPIGWTASQTMCFVIPSRQSKSSLHSLHGNSEKFLFSGILSAKTCLVLSCKPRRGFKRKLCTQVSEYSIYPTCLIMFPVNLQLRCIIKQFEEVSVYIYQPLPH